MRIYNGDNDKNSSPRFIKGNVYELVIPETGPPQLYLAVFNDKYLSGLMLVNLSNGHPWSTDPWSPFDTGDPEYYWVDVTHKYYITGDE